MKGVCNGKRCPKTHKSILNWFKAYNGLTVDPKFQLISHKSKLKVHVIAMAWFALMDHASQQKDRGDVSNVDFETMDFFFQFNDGDFEKAFNAFVDRGMIVENKLGSWEERQRNDTAERQKAYRERKKAMVKDSDNALRNEHNGDVTDVTERNQSLEEKRGEENRRDKKEVSKVSIEETPFDEIVEMWNQRFSDTAIPKIVKLSDVRKKTLKARYKDTFENNLDFVAQAFDKIKAAPHLRGDTGDWCASFDWVMKPANIIKILEGNYDVKSNDLFSGPSNGGVSISAARNSIIAEIENQ